MQMQLNVHDPDRIVFSLKGTHSWPPKPYVSLSASQFRVTSHSVSDEQIVTAYSTGMIERLTLIVDHNDGLESFVSLVVAIPGIEVSYFWHPEHIDTDDAEGLARALAELLASCGVFPTVEAARADIDRRTARTSTAGGEA